jgi:hypothetical protein
MTRMNGSLTSRSSRRSEGCYSFSFELFVVATRCFRIPTIVCSLYVRIEGPGLRAIWISSPGALHRDRRDSLSYQIWMFVDE